MRKLTITRKKSFVASLGKMKVYITDPLHSELDICGEGTRYLGDLKNGETVSFEIDENAARVYVIADKTSRNYCNDSRAVGAGCDDVVFTGENRFNPSTGNAYRFDGKADEVAKRNIKAGKKKGCLVMVIAIVVGFIIGFAISSGLL